MEKLFTSAGRFDSSSFTHFSIISSMGTVPPHSSGKMFCGTTFHRCSKSEWVRNRSRSFCESKDLAKEKTRDMVQGKWTKWISRCRSGKARSQQLNAFDTSDGVQTEMWLQLTSLSSKTYVSPLICQKNGLKD